MSFSPILHQAKWSQKFCPHIIEKYDGTINPTKFLQIYVTAIIATCGDEEGGKLLPYIIDRPDPSMAYESPRCLNQILSGALLLVFV
jgi:hypothetical protein